MSFGTELKAWRARRRLSQLDLALEAQVSARHISFLETGRARPSRAMVIRLCQHLQVPRLERNRMLTMAGLAPAYVARGVTDSEMAPVRAAVNWMLDRHAPYPAFSLDRHWHVHDMNVPASGLFGQVGLRRGDNLVAALATNTALRGAIQNLDEVIAHTVARLRTESAHLGGDPVLDAAIAELACQVTAREINGLLPAFAPTRYRLGDTSLSMLTTMTQFGTAEDIALAELKIEMMFPADDATRRALEAYC